ncbi:MAG TPA: hypothetical protein VMI54_02805 [Polyangiaceae bacterium]|nr:hypothetical protein [Polyangiaceae bacterium]
MKQAILRARRLAVSTSATALMASACGPYVGLYKPPADLPPSELATMTLDPRTKEVTIEGLRAPTADSERDGTAKEFPIESGCLALTVKYEESFLIWGEDKADKKGLGRGLGVSLANTEVHDYETLKPFRFFVSAKPGFKYWVTASFTGDQFLPRVVELDPTSGEASAKFQPDVPCGGHAPPSNTVESDADAK